MAAHTPGPWASSPGGGIDAQVDGQNQQVAVASVFNTAADARLIAAGPDLLDVVLTLISLNDEPCRLDHHGYCQEHYVSRPCIVAEAKRIVAVVEGV